MKKFHVVLQRTYNVIVDDVEADDEQDAIKQAERRCDSLEKRLTGIPIAQDIHLDDADDPQGAAVDTYGEDGNYEVESYFEFHNGHYDKKH